MPVTSVTSLVGQFYRFAGQRSDIVSQCKEEVWQRPFKMNQFRDGSNRATKKGHSMFADSARLAYANLSHFDEATGTICLIPIRYEDSRPVNRP